MDCFLMNISRLLAFMYKKKSPIQTVKNKAGQDKDATKTAYLLFTIAYIYVSREILVICWIDLQFCFLNKRPKAYGEGIQKQILFHKILRS